MSYLLDTNACIVYLNGRSISVRQRLEALSPHEVFVCSVTKAELFYGARRSNDPARTLAKQQVFLERFDSLPFDDAAADAYSQIRADLTRKGTPIGPNDMLIAAIAMANGMILVTHNVREFSRVLDLRYEDWE